MGIRARILAIVSFFAVSLVSGCGGGGDAGGGPPAPPPPNPLYVRISGNDMNSGGSPDDALRTILHAAQIARSGYTIIVGPGTYRESVTTDRAGLVPQGIMFFADTRGVTTGDRANAVVIDPGGTSPAFDLSNTGPAVVSGRVLKPTIDGFTVIGAGGAGILIKGGRDFIVQSCTVVGALGDGIRIQGTLGTRVFNNLLYDNGGNGIAAVGGATNAFLLSNTMTLNDNRGITVGNATPPAATGSTIRNNIIQSNGGDASIKIFPPGDAGYSGGFNLVLPDVYSPNSIRRVQDIHVDAQFVDPAQDNFLLRPTSPAINRGASLEPAQSCATQPNDPYCTIDPTVTIVPTPGSPGVPCFVQPSNSVCTVSMRKYLSDRTATGGNNCDRGGLDLGFHALPADRCTGAS